MSSLETSQPQETPNPYYPLILTMEVLYSDLNAFVKERKKRYPEKFTQHFLMNVRPATASDPLINNYKITPDQAGSKKVEADSQTKMQLYLSATATPSNTTGSQGTEPEKTEKEKADQEKATTRI